MERTYAPLIRQFSSIKGYQAAYTLVYALDASEGGCHLTLDRKGEREHSRSASLFRCIRRQATGCCNICVKMPCSQRSGAM